MSTYEDASLIYYPSGYKAGTAYSLKPTDGSGDLTFTRASTATRVNESGLIEEVAANVPRLDNSQGGCSTLLLEPQRTNVIKQSQDYTTSDYILSNITSININFATSPSGVLNSQKVNFGTGSGYLRSKESLASALSCSMFAKYVDYPYLQIMIGADSQHYANFDIQNGTIGNVGTNSTASIEDYGDGWYRIVINALSGTFGSAPRIYKIENLLASWALGGGAAGSCLLWGFQYELGSYATSYIPTTTTAVTRVKDDVSLTSAAVSTIAPTSGFTLFMDFYLSQDQETSRFSLFDNAYQNYVYLGSQDRPTNQSIRCEIRGSSVRFINYEPAFMDTGRHKMAVKFLTSGIKVYLDGVEVASSGANAGLSASFQKIIFGRDYPPNSGASARSITESFMIFPSALSDAQLETLTTI